MNKIIYIAELDQDVDDYIAAIYLKQKEVLAGIVCDPAPVEKDGIERRSGGSPRKYHKHHRICHSEDGDKKLEIDMNYNEPFQSKENERI